MRTTRPGVHPDNGTGYDRIVALAGSHEEMRLVMDELVEHVQALRGALCALMCIDGSETSLITLRAFVTGNMDTAPDPRAVEDALRAIEILRRTARVPSGDGLAARTLRAYVDMMGPAHELGCPCDDTCSCAGKPVNDAVNAVLTTLYGPAPGRAT
ncbi:MAG TPA: hypothetical protein VIV56_07165 [Gemmatimonadales bacterium]